MERVIMDVDTGLDDAFALLLAAGLQEINLEAVIATNGNVELEYTLENTLNILETAGSTVPVFKGADKPLHRPKIAAGEFHGKTGLDGPTFGKRRFQKAQQKSGIDVLVDTIKDNPHEITIVSIGPLTDLALAMQKDPHFAKETKQIVLMGGSFIGGNVTAEAEFNTFADPEAAQTVFTSGANLVMMPLDCTSQVKLTPDQLNHFKALKGASAQVFSACMQAYSEKYEAHGKGFPQIHDPMCIAYLIDPSKFILERRAVNVDTTEGPCYGKTTSSGLCATGGVLIAKDVDKPWFWTLVDRALDQLP